MRIHRTCLAGSFFESLLIVLFAFPALAQQTGANPGAGFPPFGSFAGSDFDTVNEGNLNIHFAIPIFQKSGRGLSVSAMLNYNGLIWSALPAPRDSNGNIIGTASWAPPSNGPAGWSLNPVAGYVTYTRTQTGPTCSNHIQLSERVGYAYHSPDGTSHYVGGNALEADCYGVAHGFSSQIAQDGSGYSVSVDDSMNAFVTDVGGDLILPTQFEVGGFSSALINPATLTDTNGNQLTASGTGLTDTLGTQAMQFSATTNSVSATYPSPTSPTTFLGVTVNYANYTVRTAFNCFWAEYRPQTWALVSNIQMPDGSSYSFTYEPAGRLASVTLPTGGTIRYTYGSADCSDGSNQSLTRTTPDGQWTYTRQITETPFSNGYQGLITSSITTVTDPLGNVSVINFGPGDIYERKRQIYSGSSTLLETMETCYGGQAFPCTATQVNSPIGRRTVRKEFPDTSGKVSQTDTYLSSFLGLVTDVYEYDFGSGAPGPLLRHTATTYNTLFANIFYNPSQPTLSYPVTIYDRPATVTVTDGSGTTQSQTSYSYDETTPAATSGTPQHVAVTGSRGNLTTTKRLVQGTTTIQKTTSYNDTGTVATDSDFKGNSTSYGYGTSSCGNSFPTTVTNPLWLAATTIWDCNGGVATSKTDQNSKKTSFNYGDPNYWRVTQTNFPDGGQVSTVYNLGTNRPWNVLQNTKLTSTQTITNETVYDSLARVSQQQLTTDPDGTTFTDIGYDGLGRVATRSNPHRAAALPTDGTTGYTYDALNRIKIVTDADNSAINTNYLRNCTTVTDEAGKARKTCLDGLGRMTQVFEDPSGLNYETDYGYDTLNNLLSVSQKGDNSAPRTRAFQYDSLSRLTSATNPESGTIYYSYDANGNVSTKVAPAPNQTGSATVTTSYSYDPLNRLTQKSYSGGTTPSVFFQYDGPNNGFGVPATNLVGRLDEEWTGTSCCGTTAEIFGYDPMGRIVLNEQYVANMSYHPVNYTYDLAGDLTSGSNGEGVTISYSYGAAARPTQVTSSLVDSHHPAQLAAINWYTPSGFPEFATFGNGLVEIRELNNRLQPCRYNLNIGPVPSSPPQHCGDNLNAPTVQDFYLTYNEGSADNGNVAMWQGTYGQTFHRNFAYDTLNRVSAMSDGFNNASCRGLNWAYDAWGNRTNQSVTAGSCFTFSASALTNNQLAGYSYDAAGNMTYDVYHHYTYDAENRIAQVDGGATASYVYDAEGRRAEKNTGGWSDYIYDLGGRPVAQVGVNGWQIGYVYLNGSLLAQYQSSTTYFAHSDHLGSTRLLTAEGPSTRIQSSGGTSLWKYYISGVCPSVSGVTYTISVMVKNQGTAAVQIGGNILNGPVIAPGVTQQVSFTEAGNGTSCVQLGFVTQHTADSIDVLAFAPSITASTAPGTNLIASGNQNFSGWAAYLGSSVTLTQAEPPLVLDSLDYQPFGEQIAGDTSTTHKFTGKERDAESNLDMFGARYYASSLGRFMIPDWAAKPTSVPYSHFGNPQSLNLYSYVQNNPTTVGDPDGHEGGMCYGCGPDGEDLAPLDPRYPEPSMSPAEKQIDTGILELSSALASGGLTAEAAEAGAALKTAVGLITTTGLAVSGTTRIVATAAGAKSDDVENGASAVTTLTSPAGMAVTVGTGGNLKAGAVASDLTSAATAVRKPGEAVKDPAGTALTLKNVVQDIKDAANAIKGLVSPPAPPPPPAPRVRCTGNDQCN